MARLSGRKAIVTGASRGIGAGIAERLAAEGADLALSARTLDEHPTLEGSLNETAERCRSYGATVEVIVADLGDEHDRLRIVPEATDALGPIDILVNNAAASINQPLADFPLKRRRLTVELNVHAPLDLAQQALPAMIEKGEGWIINVSSGSANHPGEPPYDLGGQRGIMAIYGASKAMLNRMSWGMGAEWHQYGVRVNTVQPGGAVLSPGALAVLVEKLPDHLLISLEAMCEATLFLCDCGPDHTANTEVTRDLLEREGIEVLDLAGSAPHPNGIRP